MKVKFTILFCLILLLEIIYGQFFPSWNFNIGSLNILNRIVTYFSFFAIILSATFTFKTQWLTIYVGIFLFIMFMVSTLITIYPIDTHSEPYDIATLGKYADGKKLIVREYKSSKTNRVIHDTLLVKDIGVFRRQYNN